MNTKDPLRFACYILYIYFRGRNIARIEREMRSLGYTRFHRRSLYSRTERGKLTLGWPKRYGWDDLLTSDTPLVSRPLVCSPHVSKGSSEDKGTRPQMDTDKHGCGASHQEAICVHQCSSVDENSSPASSPDFHVWLRSVSPGMTWDWKHQKLIIDQLQKVTDGTCKRLMIFLPPRHGKSELVTVRYSAWRMQQDPSLNMIVGSYNQRLADRFSRKIRKVIIDAEGSGDTPVPTDAASAYEEPPDQSARNGHKIASLPSRSTNAATSEAASGLGDKSVPAPSMFPFARQRPVNRVSEWETVAGGSFRSVGVGGGVTGFGAQLIVIDDPVKSRAEAESVTYRKKISDWFSDDLYTRLEPNGAMILIQTRWHEDDLAGRLLQEMADGGEQWDVINLPALAERSGDTPVPTDASASAMILTNARDMSIEDGEAASGLGDKSVPAPSYDWRLPGAPLCPERFDLEHLEKIRRKLGTYSFSALYQQRPAPADGGTFKREWFNKIISRAPAELHWKRAYDLAVSTGTSADYTASLRCAFDKEGNLYIEGGFRKRIEFPAQRRYVIDRMLTETNTQHGVELALHGQALIQDLRREPGLRGKMLTGVKVDTDKLTRALAWAPLAEEGKVILVRGNWIKDFLDEACSFPVGQHDDQIDCVSLAVQMLRPTGGRRAAGF